MDTSPIAYLMGLTGLTNLVQGWVLGSEGFSPTLTIPIVLAWVLTLTWMIWLVVVAWRMRASEAPVARRMKAWAAPQNEKTLLDEVLRPYRARPSALRR